MSRPVPGGPAWHQGAARTMRGARGRAIQVIVALLLGAAVEGAPAHAAAQGGAATPPGVSLDAATPASFTLPVPPGAVAGRSVLALTLEPAGAGAPASFVVRVAASPGAAGDEAELGSVA